MTTFKKMTQRTFGISTILILFLILLCRVYCSLQRDASGPPKQPVKLPAFTDLFPSRPHKETQTSRTTESLAQGTTPIADHNASTSPTSASSSGSPSIVPNSPNILQTQESPWEFNHTRDADTYTLTQQQCNSAFGPLFAEIHRAADCQRSTSAKITPSDLDISWKEDGAFRGLIFDQKLYILEAKVPPGSANPRALALLHSIHRALLTSPTPLPNIEFSFIDSDIPDASGHPHIIWALTRHPSQPQIWIMSDFGYWSWANELLGGYAQIRSEIAASELQFKDKKKQVVWRGALKTNKFREDLVRVTKGKEWADVQVVKWAGSLLESATAAKALTVPEQCQYQFVLQTEGRSYSGRGKYLHNCNSVVIVPKRTWVEPQHRLLISSGPEQNFVEIEQDFSDLESTVSALLKDEANMERIARQGTQVFRDRYLTPAAQTCYWREMVRAWAEVSFEPQLWEEVEGKRKLRGVPFETFAIQSMSPPTCTWLGKVLLRC